MRPWMACTSRPLRIGLYEHNHSSNAVVGVGEHLANCNLCGQVAVSVRYLALSRLLRYIRYIDVVAPSGPKGGLGLACASIAVYMHTS
jgi:hypothetical protein